jgi:choline dehydrogenase-like flavoprotein
MALLHVIACAALSAAVACPVPKDWTVQEWDAIIVGAGTAGIVVADRLSEAGLKTLLLEQGGASYGITGGDEKPHWLSDTALSRVDVPGLCRFCSKKIPIDVKLTPFHRLNHFCYSRLITYMQARRRQRFPGLHSRR